MKQKFALSFFKELDNFINEQYGNDIHCYTYYNHFDECFTTRWDHKIGKENNTKILNFVKGFGLCVKLLSETNHKDEPGINGHTFTITLDHDWYPFIKKEVSKELEIPERQIVSTLDGFVDTHIRKDGNSTRQVDYAIKIIFSPNTICFVQDHFEGGSNRKMNELLFGKILKRLSIEYIHLYEKDKFLIDPNKLTIQLKQD